MIGSNDSKFDRKYNFIRLKLSEFYLVQRYNFFSLENGIFAVTKSVLFHKPLHATEIWLKL